MEIRTEARFPPITGVTLAGRTRTLPEGFDASLNLVFVTFRRASQATLDSWLPVAADLEASAPALRYYELAVLDRRLALARPIIDRALRHTLPDAAARERTITSYTDLRTVRRALDIDASDTVHAFLVDRDGDVYWRARGARADADLSRLRAVVEALQ